MKKTMKHLLIVSILIVTLFSSVFALYIPVGGDPKNYTDIEGHWAYDSIKYVIKNGLFKGITNNEFKPNENMTRATFVVVLWRLTGEDLAYNKQVDGGGYKRIHNYVNMFWDMDDNGTYTDYVAWANHFKIISGYSKREFGPDDPITREQLASILYNYLKEYKRVRGFETLKVNEPIRFTDNDLISDWAKDKVSIIQQVGLMYGREDESFDPQGHVTRAEVATIIERLDKMF